MKNKIRTFGTTISRNESVEGKTIEQEIELMVNNGEEIGDKTMEPIYTERKAGVPDAYNVKFDKWNEAQKAMQKVSKSYEAKRRDRINERENPEPLQEKGEIEDQSI